MFTHIISFFFKDQKGSLSTSGHLFRRYIKNLETQDPSCPLCHRGFDSVDEVTELISDVRLLIIVQLT